MTSGYLSYSACRADQERNWLSDVRCDGAFEMFDGDEVLDADKLHWTTAICRGLFIMS